MSRCEVWVSEEDGSAKLEHSEAEPLRDVKELLEKHQQDIEALLASSESRLETTLKSLLIQELSKSPPAPSQGPPRLFLPSSSGVTGSASSDGPSQAIAKWKKVVKKSHTAEMEEENSGQKAKKVTIGTESHGSSHSALKNKAPTEANPEKKIVSESPGCIRSAGSAWGNASSSETEAPSQPVTDTKDEVKPFEVVTSSLTSTNAPPESAEVLVENCADDSNLARVDSDVASSPTAEPVKSGVCFAVQDSVDNDADKPSKKVSLKISGTESSGFSKEARVTRSDRVSTAFGRGTLKGSGGGEKRGSLDSQGGPIQNITQMKMQITALRKQIKDGKAPLSMTRAGLTMNRLGWVKAAEILDTFVNNMSFQNVVGVFIVVNAMLIGVETDWQAKNRGKSSPLAFLVLEAIFCIFFTLELMLRIFIQRREFFTGDERRWNIFDFVIVSFALVEMVLQLLFVSSTQGFSFLRVLRVLRLARTMRVIRVMEFFRELRLVVSGILNSLASLVWLILLLVMIIFVFSVYLTQVATEELVLADKGESALSQQNLALLELHYHTLASTIFTLFKAISNGVTWGELAYPLLEISPICVFILSAYMAFTMFAVLNIVTGVFVNNANKASEADYETVLLEETVERQKHIDQVQAVFDSADSHGKGELDWHDFKRHFSDFRVQSYFRFLKLDTDISGAARLFRLLDFDGDGSVNINEFVTGCTRMRGMARSLDVAMLAHDIKKNSKKVETLIDGMNYLLCAMFPHEFDDAPSEGSGGGAQESVIE